MNDWRATFNIYFFSHTLIYWEIFGKEMAESLWLLFFLIQNETVSHRRN
jgi:hypothetical protein